MDMYVAKSLVDPTASEQEEAICGRKEAIGRGKRTRKKGIWHRNVGSLPRHVHACLSIVDCDLETVVSLRWLLFFFFRVLDIDSK